MPQDDVLQFFYIDNIYSTMPENPTLDRAGFILYFTPEISTRRYEFVMRDSIFYDRNNDPELIFGVIGSFNENVIISNVTVSQSQIALRATPLFTIMNLTVDGLNYENSIVNGDLLLHINS